MSTVWMIFPLITQVLLQASAFLPTSLNISGVFFIPLLFKKQSLQAESVALTDSKAHVGCADSSAGCVLLLLVPWCSWSHCTEKHFRHKSMNSHICGATRVKGVEKVRLATLGGRSSITTTITKYGVVNSGKQNVFTANWMLSVEEFHQYLKI